MRLSTLFIALLVVLFAVSAYSYQQKLCKNQCAKKCAKGIENKHCLKKCVPVCKRQKKNDRMRRLHDIRQRKKATVQAELEEERQFRVQEKRQLMLEKLKRTNRFEYERIIKEENQKRMEREKQRRENEEHLRKATRLREQHRRKELETREVQKHAQQMVINEKLLNLIMKIKLRKGLSVQLSHSAEMDINGRLLNVMDRVQKEHDYRVRACKHADHCIARASELGSCSCNCQTGSFIDYGRVNTTVAQPKKLKHSDFDDESDPLVLQTKGLTKSFLNSCVSANIVCQTPEAVAVRPFCRKFVKQCTPYGLYRRKF